MSITTSPRTTRALTGLMTVNRLLEALQHESEELTWAEGYADGTPDNGRGVLSCNWNTENLLRRSCRADAALQTAKARVKLLERDLYSTTPTTETLRVAREAERAALAPWDERAQRIGDVLERAGYSLEWSDCGSQCGACNCWIQTEPDWFGWTPDYQVGGGDIICGACLRSEIGSHLEEHLDQAEGPTALEDCEFAANLDLARTWAAIEALNDDDLIVCDSEHSLADLHEHQWPALQYDGRVVFRTPELDEPVAAALGLLATEDEQP